MMDKLTNYDKISDEMLNSNLERLGRDFITSKRGIGIAIKVETVNPN